MAVLGLSDVSAVLNLIYGAGVSKTLRRDAVLPNLLRVRRQANSTATFRVKIGARSSAAAKAQGYDVQSSDFTADTRLQGTLAWAHYEAYAAVTGTAMRIAAANGAYAGAPDLLSEELTDAAEELAVKISSDTYAGSVAASPVEVEGLARAVDATGTYAGIAQGTYATWASGEATGTLASLTLDSIRTGLLRPIKDATGRNPDFVTLPGNLHDKIAALVDPAQRILRAVNAPVGSVDMAAMGFTGFQLDGVPFIEDRHCTANTMYGFTAEDIEYTQVPPAWSMMDPGQMQGLVKAVTGQVLPLSQIEQAMRDASQRLQFQINALSKTGDSTKLEIVGDFQLCVKRRNAFAKLTLS